MKWLAAAVLALLAGQAQAQLDRALMIRVAPSVLKIEAVSAEGRYNLGSGVIVAPGKVVTNCHVTRYAQRVQIVRGDQRWAASRQAADMGHDLCVLQVPRLEAEPAPIGRSALLAAGQDVVAIGYTGGVGMQLSDGDVVALHPLQGGQIVQSSNWFSSGASGGGLFNGDGALVGILTFRLRGGASHYFSAPAEWLQALLDDETAYVPIAPLAGKSYWELPIEAQPYFLQAAALEESRQWPALSTLAERWSREDETDAEAHYTQGVALEGLQQVAASIAAFKKSLEVNAAYARSWARLAQIYLRQGQLRDARQAVARLATIDPKLARAIAAELEKP